MPKNKTAAIHLRMFAGFRFNNTSAPQIWLHRQFSSAQFQKRINIRCFATAGLF